MSNLPVKRDEIHSVNSYRPPSAETAYRLIKWKPVYDMIVAGHIIGKSNKQLAEDFDYTPVHISNILRCDHAQSLIKQAHDTIRTTVVVKSEEAVDIQARIKQKALKRAEEFLDNDEAARNSPFAYLNTIKSFTGLSAPSVSVPNVNVQVQNNQTNVNGLKPEHVDRLSRALEISNG